MTEVNAEIITPFGPSIFKVKIPNQIVDDLNQYVDNTVAGDCIAGRDYSVCPAGWHDVGGLPSSWVLLLATSVHTPHARRRFLRENASAANKRQVWVVVQV